MGLTTTLNGILGLLNLAELGIGGAIGFHLYKPLYTKEYKTIREIVGVMGYLYKKIALFILGSSLIITCFIPFIFRKSDFPFILIAFCFLTSLVSNLLGYFFNYRQIVLEADQRTYIVRINSQICNYIKVLVQVACVYVWCNYYLWAGIELVFSIFYTLLLNRIIHKTIPWFFDKENAPDVHGHNLLVKHSTVLRTCKQYFFRKLSMFAILQTDKLVVFIYLSLSTVALYSNYMMLFDRVLQLFCNLANGLTSSVGNLIAEGNTKKIEAIYWELQTAYYLIASILSFSFFRLLEFLVAVWLGEEYLLGKTVLLLLSIQLFLRIVVLCTNSFICGYGLYSDVWAAIAQGIIHCLVSLVCGYYWKLPGILLGCIASVGIIEGIWRPIFLYIRGFKIPCFYYWIKLLLILFSIGIGYTIQCFAFPILHLRHPDSIVAWLIYSFVWTIMISINMFMVFYLLNPSLRQLVRREIALLRTRLSSGHNK